MKYFTSDTHYSHKNICRGTSEWEPRYDASNKARDFKTIEEMNEQILTSLSVMVCITPIVI